MSGEPRFGFRAGVRLSGTTVACDPSRSANEVVFLSHAPFPGDRRIADLMAQRNAVRQLVATETTRLLLGEVDLNVLVCEYGRPFALGDLRLELIPSGYSPGAAALLCRHGENHILYAGAVRTGSPVTGAQETQVRPADAVCIDATFGAPQFVFPPRAEALSRVITFAQSAIAAHATAVILMDEANVVSEVATGLAGVGIKLQAHQHFAAHSAALRAIGIETPALKRLSAPRAGVRNPNPGAVLWPVQNREAPALARLIDVQVAFVSGFAADKDARDNVGADVAIPLAGRAGYDDLLAYVRATGAREIATVRGHAEALARNLRAMGLSAYRLGPPEQIPLFESPPATVP